MLRVELHSIIQWKKQSDLAGRERYCSRQFDVVIYARTEWAQK